jgi:hypothetical protein
MLYTWRAVESGRKLRGANLEGLFTKAVLDSFLILGEDSDDSVDPGVE